MGGGVTGNDRAHRGPLTGVAIVGGGGLSRRRRDSDSDSPPCKPPGSARDLETTAATVNRPWR